MRQIRTRLETSHRAQPARTARAEQVGVAERPAQTGSRRPHLLLKRHGYPDIRRATDRRADELRRRDANDCIDAAVEGDGLANHRCVCVEAILPERMRDDRHAHGRPAPVFRGEKRPSSFEPHAEDLEEVSGDQVSSDLVGLAAALVGKRYRAERGHVLEHAALTQVDDVRVGHRGKPLATIRARVVHAGQRRRCGDPWRSEQDGVDGGENDRVGADAKCQRQEDDGREAWRG